MVIVVACPSCGTRMRAAEDLIGQQVKCARCAEVFEAIAPSGQHRTQLPDPAPAPQAPRPRGPLPLRDSPIPFQDDEDYSRPVLREDRHDDPRDWRDRRDREDRNDYDDRPYRRSRSENNSLSMISMIMGIIVLPMHCACGALGTVVTVPIGITVIVLGVLGHKREKAKGQATAGIVLGIISLLLDFLLIVIFLALLNSGALSGPGSPFAPFGGVGSGRGSGSGSGSRPY
jgi:predicted Zn finger-like uncharacterized protein